VLASINYTSVAFRIYLPVGTVCIFLVFAYTFAWRLESNDQVKRHANLLIQNQFPSFLADPWKSVGDAHHPIPRVS
jgi:hypothetical protein